MVRKKLGEDERILTEDLGGRLGEVIAELRDKHFFCGLSGSKKCNSKQPLDEFRGYEHENGLPDKDGKRYWTYWNCPGCGHDWSHPHLTLRLNLREY